MLFFLVNSVSQEYSTIKLTLREKRFIEKLYKSESKRMWLTALKILSSHNKAEDAVQQAFEKIIRKVSLLRSFKSKEKVSAYVYLTTRNTALSMLRSEKKCIPLDNMEQEIISNENIEFQVIKILEVEALKDIVKHINPTYSDAFAMRYFLHMNYPDIADTLSVTEKTAQNYVSKCKSLLKEYRLENEN